MTDFNFQECESCLCFSARKKARILTQHYDQYLRPFGLRATQFTLLVMLIRFDSAVPMQKVSKALSMDRSTLTRNLQPLLDKGYIQFESTQDKRAHPISITERGKTAAESAFPAWKNAQESAVSLVS